MAKLIGTAGHVDHGKTALIKALTNYETDRLPEEQRRGLTIEIGFAEITLPNGVRASIVDVPGHEKFVRNMLVGALGTDVALLCVAADSSVMPQTIEHYQILTLLPVQEMVVAVTRSDLVDDERIKQVTGEVRTLLANSRFEHSPIIPASSVTGSGLDDLRTALSKALIDNVPPTELPWYMPIDRAFSIKGQGLVITGTLMQGSLRAGADVQIEPGGLTARVRQIEVHDQRREICERGERVAINLGGLRQEDVARGMMAAAPGHIFSTDTIDADVTWLERPKNGTRVHVAVGADSVVGRAFMDKAAETRVQLRLERLVAATKGQPLIIRNYSPQAILGGGTVSIVQATPKAHTQPTIQGSIPSQVLSVVAGSLEGMETSEVCRLLSASPQELGDVFEDLVNDNQLIGFAGLWMTSTNLKVATQALLRALDTLHAKDSQKLHFPKELVVRQAGFSWRDKPLDRLMAYLIREGHLTTGRAGIGSPEWSANLNPSQRNLLERLKEKLVSAGCNVPNPRDLAIGLNVPVQAITAILQLGAEIGELIRLEESVWYTRAQLDTIVETARSRFKSEKFTAAEFRDLLKTSRRYAIPILEHMDSRQITVRRGDFRAFVQTN